MTRFQRLALATTAATYVMVVIGGTVRVTDSGLACPDWPTCNGRLIPAFQEHTLIEYSHRLFATIVSVLVLATAAGAWRYLRRDRGVVVLASTAVGVLAAQILLGAVTVRANLPAAVVTAHLGTAMLLLASVTLLTLLSFQRTRAIVRPAAPGSAGARTFLIVSLAAAIGLYLLLLSGAYTASSGAGSACSTWPLCNGQVIPHGSRYVEIHFLHRLLGVAVTAALALLVAVTYRRLASERWVTRAVRDAAVLFAVQILIGALNVWTDLATGVRILHLATASALWIALVAIAWIGYTRLQPEHGLESEPQARAVHDGTRPPQEVTG